MIDSIGKLVIYYSVADLYFIIDVIFGQILLIDSWNIIDIYVVIVTLVVYVVGWEPIRPWAWRNKNSKM